MKACRTILVSIALAGAQGAGSANAMDLTRTVWNGHQVLLASGRIERGDAERFAAALATAPALPHGLPVVLLDSPGGDVAEALNISKVFSRKKVHTVIPNGKSCASACASIVFVAGTMRTIEEDGRLGQHSCAIRGVKDESCNETISNHATEHGVSHGSIQAFISYAAPADMLWFSRRDADCWGITRYPFTGESGFGKSEPCFFRYMTKRWPAAQSVWRVDFKSDGFRAFTRPDGDHVREGELSIYCSKSAPGVLFLSADIPGASQEVAKSIKSATLEADPVSDRNLPVTVRQADAKFSQISVAIKKEDAASFLKSASFLALTLERIPPQTPLFASALLSTSRQALSFAASHCMS